MTEIFNILGEVAKEEDVLLTNFSSDLNIGSVTGTDDKASIQTEW